MCENNFDPLKQNENEEKINDKVNQEGTSENANGSDDDWAPYYDFHGGYTPPSSQDSNKNNNRKKNSSSAAPVIIACAAVFVCLVSLAVIGILGLGGGGLPSLTASTVTSDEQIASGTSSYVDTQSDGNHSFTGSDLNIEVEDVDSSISNQTGVKVAKKVCPSVVGVLVYKNKNNSYTLSGSGSGVILSEDGFIITNHHVIDGADKIAVTLYSESGMNENDSYIATLVGSDSTTDIALLKIEATGLTKASFINSDDVLVGETVYAIGNPGGIELSTSITQGLVSGLNRQIGPFGYIQTDVAVNPGNSGGALVNVNGQVIGIISEKIVTVSNISAEGLSFAIPSNIALDIVEDLLEYGYVKGRVSLGISVNVYTDAYAEMLQLPEGCRILITDVVSDSNAAKAGVKKDLMLTYLNGIAISTTDELRIERDKNKAGDEVTLTLYNPKTKSSSDVTFILQEDRG